MTHGLIFFPDYSTANPYQVLLYEHAGRHLHPRAGTITEAVALQRQLMVGSRMIFHLHWEDAVFRNEPSEAAAWHAAQTFLDDLEGFLDAGGHLVWTLHNEGPHDHCYLPVHAELCAKLAELADVVHVHSLAAFAFARAHLSVDAARLAVIHHGHYAGYYPRFGGPAIAGRAALGLGEAARLLLLFGRLGRYKGGFELLNAFAAVDDPGLWLLVAGKQVDPLSYVLDELPATIRRRIVVEDRFIPHEQVPRLFHACDAAVLPYRASLTSGSALLALSQARPVIAPALPGLVELLTDGSDALLYDPSSPQALELALQRFLGLDEPRLAAMQVSAHIRAESFDWRSSGLLLDGVYTRLLATLRPQRVPSDAAMGRNAARRATPTTTVQPLHPSAADAA